MFTYYYLMCSAGAFGLVVGSFLNVVIHRLPLGESVVSPRSRCPTCRSPIAWYDNLPVLSYLILRGRCRGCRTPISPRYALVELLTGAVSIAVFWHVVPAVELHHVAPSISGAGEVWAVPATVTWVGVLTWLYYFAFFAGLIAVFFIDLRHFIVPNEVTFALLPVGVAGAIGLWYAGAAVPHPLQSVLGAVAGGGLLLGVGQAGYWIFRKEAMGMGDVKLLAVIGAFLGAWPTLLVVVLLSALGGSVIGIALRVAGRAHRGVPADPRDAAGDEEVAANDAPDASEDPDAPPEPGEGPPIGYYIPFGPFLVAGAFVYFFVGDLLVDFYRASLY